jgi:hypothetical protein
MYYTEKELKELLSFAFRNMRFEIPYGEDSEYDFCIICNNPDWNHKEDCEGIGWYNRVKEILSK